LEAIAEKERRSARELYMAQDITINNIHNSQINNANGDSTINATQNNSLDMQHIMLLIDSVKQSIVGTMSSDTADIANEHVEILEDQLSRPDPKPSIIKTAIKGLKTIKGSIEFTAAITTLYSYFAPALGLPK